MHYFSTVSDSSKLQRLDKSYRYSHIPGYSFTQACGAKCSYAHIADGNNLQTDGCVQNVNLQTDGCVQNVNLQTDGCVQNVNLQIDGCVQNVKMHCKACHTYGILLQCVDPLGCITSHCLCNVFIARSEVERDTALHKQRDVIQLTGSTHCISIPFIIYIDNEDKTYFRTFHYIILFPSFKVINNILQQCSTH